MGIRLRYLGVTAGNCRDWSPGVCIIYFFLARDGALGTGKKQDTPQPPFYHFSREMDAGRFLGVEITGTCLEKLAKASQI